MQIGYTGDIFKEAKVYSEHADKDKVDIEDVRLAIQTKVNHSFTQPPPREVQQSTLYYTILIIEN